MDKDMVKSIAQALIAECKSLDKAVTVSELNSRGVTGELLKEVFMLLDKTGFVVDTQPPQAFEKIVEENIQECKDLLLIAPSIQVQAELELLQKPSKLSLGVKYDHSERNIMVEADTGDSLYLRRISKKSKNLIKDAESYPYSIILLDGEVKSLDKKNFSYKKVH